VPGRPHPGVIGQRGPSTFRPVRVLTTRAGERIPVNRLGAVRGLLSRTGWVVVQLRVFVGKYFGGRSADRTHGGGQDTAQVLAFSNRPGTGPKA